MKNQKFLSGIDFTKAPKLDFLKRLTNQTGIIQHTKYAVPDRNMGYSVDDNSRALIVSVLYNKLFKKPAILELGITFLSFIHHSKTSDNWFYNFFTFDNKFKDKSKTEDGFGRCVWALGYTIYADPRRDLTSGAQSLTNEITDNFSKLKAPRAKAYCLAGLYYLYETEKKEIWLKYLKDFADDLALLFEKKSTADWQWFESYLTYSNGIFPYAMALAYLATKNQRYLEVAESSMRFLDKESRNKENVPSPIGCNGWYFKGKEKAIFDQQPVEAADMTIAYSALYKATLEKDYFNKALDWFSWYFGNNINSKEVYDSVTNGCFDALTADGVNLNQGAESIVTFLIAYLDISDIVLKTKEPLV